MKKAQLKVFILLLFLCNEIFAQNVVDANGGSISNNIYNADYSVGEIISITLRSSGTKLNLATCGVIQPLPLYISSVNSLSQTSLIYFPNPITDYVIIKDEENLIYSYLVVDSNGKQLLNDKFISSKISLAELPSGIYIIRLFDQKNENTYNLRILKN